jgi:hypothetical protein
MDHDRTDPRRNPLDQQRWAFDGSHCAGISAERVTTHVWLEAVLDELKGSRVPSQDPVLQGQFMRQLIVGPLHSVSFNRYRSCRTSALPSTLGQPHVNLLSEQRPTAMSTEMLVPPITH